MRTLGAGSVDCVVTDPPYGVNLNPTTCGWDTWPGQAVWQECHRITTAAGQLAVIIAPHVAHERIPDVISAGWHVLEVGCWIWGNGRPVAQGRLKRSYDLVYFLTKTRRVLYVTPESRGHYLAGSACPERGDAGGNRNKSPSLPFGRQYRDSTHRRSFQYGDDYYPANVACLPGNDSLGSYERIFAVKRERANVDTRHPTQKPTDLMAQIVKLISQPDEIVLDPFAGTATTGVACVQTGRSFIGCEISAEYFEIARQRIAAAQAQTVMPLEVMNE
jgi:site-specific DNA-methyltransferase (adenine-specific)